MLARLADNALIFMTLPEWCASCYALLKNTISLVDVPRGTCLRILDIAIVSAEAVNSFQNKHTPQAII